MTINQEAALKAIGTVLLAAAPAVAWMAFFDWIRQDLPRYLYAPLGFVGGVGGYLVWFGIMLAFFAAMNKVSRERVGGSR